MAEECGRAEISSTKGAPVHLINEARGTPLLYHNRNALNFFRFEELSKTNDQDEAGRENDAASILPPAPMLGNQEGPLLEPAATKS
jgi:hypothetical protein